MDTDIVKQEHGVSYNKHNQPVIDCKTGCGRKTTMTGTRLCDKCWEDAHEHLRKQYDQGQRHAT